MQHFPPHNCSLIISNVVEHQLCYLQSKSDQVFTLYLPEYNSQVHCFIVQIYSNNRLSFGYSKTL